MTRKRTTYQTNWPHSTASEKGSTTFCCLHEFEKAALALSRPLCTNHHYKQINDQKMINSASFSHMIINF
jgi:hypothetical protein